jgi:hypothetical protein
LDPRVRKVRLVLLDLLVILVRKVHRVRWDLLDPRVTPGWLAGTWMAMDLRTTKKISTWITNGMPWIAKVFKASREFQAYQGRLEQLVQLGRKVPLVLPVHRARLAQRARPVLKVRKE